MNVTHIIGNLTADPKSRTVQTENGDVTVCSFTVAVNGRRQSNGEQNTTYFNVTAWRQLGENCTKYLSKGKKVRVSGEISARAYNTNNGELRASLELNANDVEFLTPVGTSYEEAQQATKAAAYGQPYQQAPQQQSFPTGYGVPIETDELPF